MLRTFHECCSLQPRAEALASSSREYLALTVAVLHIPDITTPHTSSPRLPCPLVKPQGSQHPPEQRTTELSSTFLPISPLNVIRYHALHGSLLPTLPLLPPASAPSSSSLLLDLTLSKHFLCHCFQCPCSSCPRHQPLGNTSSTTKPGFAEVALSVISSAQSLSLN